MCVDSLALISQCVRFCHSMISCLSVRMGCFKNWFVGLPSFSTPEILRLVTLAVRYHAQFTALLKSVKSET